MMEEKLGQEQAFPTSNYIDSYFGMSKRFYAACAAMQGVLANRELQIAIYLDCGNSNLNPQKLNGDAFLIKQCYDWADELLKQENQ